jgi:hypothetical protein
MLPKAGPGPSNEVPPPTSDSANQNTSRRVLKRRRTEIQPEEELHGTASDTPHSSKKRRGGDEKQRKWRESKTPAPALLQVKQEPDETVLSNDQDKVNDPKLGVPNF